jgi:hypothetical protein
MNIFEIFCAGDGRINEPNMSSALHFLLSPNAPHGLGISALTEFLAPLHEDIATLRAPGRSAGRRAMPALRQLLAGFERIEIFLEEKVFNPVDAKDRKHRDIDLVLRCFTGDEAPALVIAIENKIAAGSSSDEQQLSQEYAFLRAKIDTEYQRTTTDSARTPIVFIYLTPDSLAGPSLAQWSQLTLPESAGVTGSDFKVHYTWRDMAVPGPRTASVAGIARTLLRKERDGSISPASSHASLFLRSMIQFIANDFSPERLDPGLFDEANNARETRTPEQFWTAWADTKPGSRPLAQALHERIQAALTARAQARGAPAPEVKFTKSRIGFFIGTDRPVAIMMQNGTTNGRVVLQVKQGPNPDFAQRLNSFQDSDRIEVRFAGTNLEVQVPSAVAAESLDRLLALLIEQLP